MDEPSEQGERSRRRSRLTALVGAVLGIALVATVLVVVRSSDDPACDRAVSHPEWSVARRWDEALLNAIRRALPAPTVHARNLFHTSAAMWDAWAAYDPDAAGFLVDEKHTADDVAAARDESISYAAYRVLVHRYLNAVGASDSIPEFDRLMRDLCYPTDITTTVGDTPAALGNRIAAAAIDAGLADGSNEADGYSSDYEPVNPALVVTGSKIEMTDPNRWQPLQLEHMISQNGIPIENGVQQFIGPHWGHVTGFALPAGGDEGLPMDPGAPPYLGDPVTDQAFKDSAVEVVRLSSLLDPSPDTMVDVSPGTIGANPLGTNDGQGYDLNPATGEPYEENLVNQGDFARALTEFWADGPQSETPPGHWNVVANDVSDSPGFEFRIGGSGPTVDRLEWDVKLYFALNGAVHDAAIAAWGAKGYYDTARPISMIRYLGSLGQSSDPDAPSFDPDGIPLEPGLVEVVTRATTAPGGRHEALAGYEGEIAVHAWSGNPADPETETSGAAWILATEWVPYQRPTFVTPAFSGYVSGHSTFSRSAAEVLTAMTGSEFFPGGLFEWTIPAGSLEVEAGPTQDVTLQAATYFDAADQAGISRLFGGIHVRADDFEGRRMGSLCGLAAWARAQEYFEGVVVDEG
ncbi:MAG: vanadium-dependent haloperoxidase [Actinomycetota bacterium]